MRQVPVYSTVAKPCKSVSTISLPAHPSAAAFDPVTTVTRRTQRLNTTLRRFAWIIRNKNHFCVYVYILGIYFFTK